MLALCTSRGGKCQLAFYVFRLLACACRLSSQTALFTLFCLFVFIVTAQWRGVPPKLAWHGEISLPNPSALSGSVEASPPLMLLGLETKVPPAYMADVQQRRRHGVRVGGAYHFKWLKHTHRAAFGVLEGRKHGQLANSKTMRATQRERENNKRERRN